MQERLVGNDPARAVTLYETFLAACYVKIEELDDSSGSFGQFVDELYCGWIEARQADGADPDKTASRLLAWMDQDNYGFCYHLEMDAVKVFDKTNLAAFVKQIRTRFDAAWADYREHPSKYTCDDLMKYVPKAERASWHEKAIEAAMGADQHSVMELLLATKELDRLADLVRQAKDDDLKGLSHYATEPVAKKLEKPHPDLAARLWRAQGLRIVNAKKSKYYDAALSNFESAKRCFKRAGLEAEWNKTVSRIRTDHHRKSSFMPGFERLVEGTGPSDEPSFLDRANARWSARERGSR